MGANSTISGNFVIGAQAGILSNVTAADMVLARNQIYECAGAAITLSGTSIIVAENICQHNWTSGTPTAEIVNTDTATGTMLVGNSITPSSGVADFLDLGVGTSLTPYAVAKGELTGQQVANASIASYAVGGTSSDFFTFEIKGFVNLTADSSSTNVIANVSWMDEAGISQSQPMALIGPSAAIAAETGEAAPREAITRSFPSRFGPAAHRPLPRSRRSAAMATTRPTTWN